MGISLNDILAALAGCLDATTQAILAMTFGFAMIPSALAYLVGIIGCLVFKSVVPVSFQAETITLGGTMGRNIRERATIIFLGGAITALMGATGALTAVVDFAGDDILAAMMAGVGLILAKAGFDLVKENKKLGAISMVVAIAVYFLTQDLVWTIVSSVVITTVAAKLLKEEIVIGEINNTKFKLMKPAFNAQVIRGALSVMCLTIGGNIAYGSITADIAGTTANADHISIYSGVADMVSSIFGGAPIDVIISATAAADHPLLSAILLMAIMLVILLTGLLPKIAKYVPVQAIAGTLFVLGVFVTIPDNAPLAFNATGDYMANVACGVTMGVTAISDPFFGMVAGLAVRLLGGLFGIL